jgi:hypothetical protein
VTTNTQTELESFTRYAQERIGRGNHEFSLDELFDSWRLENPSEEARREDVAAVAAAIEDFRKGDRGLPAGELSSELRRKLGLSQP